MKYSSDIPHGSSKEMLEWAEKIWNPSALDVQVVWKSIEDYPDYEVSEYGNVQSFKPIRNNAPPPVEPRLLSLGEDRDGYATVVLYKKSEPFKHRVSRLVCTAFHGSPKDGQVVRHLDGNNQNDFVENLMWGSVKENSEDSILHGTQVNGERVNTSKLSAENVVYILDSKKGHSELARELGITPGAIWHIRAGRTWKHVST